MGTYFANRRFLLGAQCETMPQLFPGHMVPRDDMSGRILLCTLIAAATAVFFWAYSVAAYREPPFVPIVTHQPPTDGLTDIPQPPMPDMRSEEVALSNADVAVARPAPLSH